MAAPNLTRFKSTWLNVPMHAAAQLPDEDAAADVEEEASIRSSRPQSAGKPGNRPQSAGPFGRLRDSISRTLRPFGCNLTLSILYHHEQSSGSRAMAPMPDAIGYSDLQKLVERTLKLAPGSAKRLALQYVTTDGTTAMLSGHSALRTWLMNTWAVHPVELHVYDVSALVKGQEARENKVLKAYESMLQSSDCDGVEEEKAKAALLELLVDEVGEKKRHDLSQAVAYHLGYMGHVPLDGFVEAYNGSLDDLRGAGKEEVSHRFQQAMVEAWSVRCTFAELEARPETVPEMALWLTPAAHSGVGGVLKLDARGHSYDIRAQFPAGCVAVKHRDKWVRARTMLHQRAEDWEDETHQMGAHLSPLVAVEIEQGASFVLP